MNLSVSTTVAGDLATKWHLFAAVTIVQPVAVPMHLRELIDPRLLPTRSRLFRRSRIRVEAEESMVEEEVVVVEGANRSLINGGKNDF
jgi:hypothetical protein